MLVAQRLVRLAIVNYRKNLEYIKALEIGSLRSQGFNPGISTLIIGVLIWFVK